MRPDPQPAALPSGNAPHQDALARAEDALRARIPLASSCPHRLAYHAMAPSGWLNDPNGLIRFRGEYHLFYQHHPYSAAWGPMHWGHLASDDLVHWRHLPIALAPSEAYDEHPTHGGCFSGSAVDHDGVLTLVYTGHVEGGAPKETQNIATSLDGIHFDKHPRNPVIATSPVDGSDDARDPKVWRHGDHWYMVLGTGRDGIGKAVVYRSADLLAWDYLGVAASSDGTLGSMWECPDLFPLDGRHVLIVSPCGVDRPKVVALIGEFAHGSARFTTERHQELDAGPDFYAAQTFLDEDGRRIVIGWMHRFGTPIPTTERGWACAMSVPRVLSIDPRGRVRSHPVAELARLRGAVTHFPVARIGGEYAWPEAAGDSVELEIVIDLTRTSASRIVVMARRSEDGAQRTVVAYEPATRRLSTDRDLSGGGVAGISSVIMAPCGELSLRIFVDRSAIEVFANDGEVWSDHRLGRADPYGIDGCPRFHGVDKPHRRGRRSRPPSGSSERPAVHGRPSLQRRGLEFHRNPVCNVTRHEGLGDEAPNDRRAANGPPGSTE